MVEATMVGEMLALEQAMINFTTAEMAVTNNGDAEDGPRTPDTDIVPPVQAPNHEELMDVDTIMQTEQGRAWFLRWKQGDIDDDMVEKKWGKDVLELSRPSFPFLWACRLVWIGGLLSPASPTWICPCSPPWTADEDDVLQMCPC